MEQLHNVYLLLGGNIEPRISFLKNAAELIAERIGEIIESSSIYETPPWGFEAETPFLNQVLLVKSRLEATLVLDEILNIENEQGRTRVGETYISRKIDIDILYFDDLVLNSSRLVIPHPRMQNRRFTMAPLTQIAASKVHPVLKLTNQELLDRCPDDAEIKILAS